jgi:hypothetical protein
MRRRGTVRGMSAYDVVLFFHVAVLLFAFGLTGVLHGSEWLMARASTVTELRATARAQKLGPLFAPIIVALMGLGFALIGMSKEPAQFDFSDPFAWTATVVLVILFLDGPLILGRHATAMGKALAAAPDGPVTPELRAMTLDRTIWYASHMNTFAVLGVVLNMATKPSLVGCVVDIVGGAGIGAVIGLYGLSRAAAAVPAA